MSVHGFPLLPECRERPLQTLIPLPHDCIYPQIVWQSRWPVNVPKFTFSHTLQHMLHLVSFTSEIISNTFQDKATDAIVMSMSQLTSVKCGK